MDQADFIVEMHRLADVVAAKSDTDVILYSGPISRPHDVTLIEQCLERQRRRKNVLLLLSTFGGDAHPAYRIARCLQERYERFTVFVNGYCKSAGTLIALGANTLVMSAYAELGPLDVQIRKPDELGHHESGLTAMQALVTLRQRSFQALVEHAVDLEGQLDLTTRTALDIAARLTVGVFSPIYQQVDPMRLGEIDRAINIALEYGRRLDKRAQNMKDGSLEKLVGEYFSHSFVIDQSEARELLKEVREPTEDENRLVEHLSGTSRRPIDADRPIIFYLGSLPPAEAGSDVEGNAKGAGDPPAGGSPSDSGDSQDRQAGSGPAVEPTEGAT